MNWVHLLLCAGLLVLSRASEDSITDDFADYHVMQKRLYLKNPKDKWPGGRVPYFIHRGFTAAQLRDIQTAMSSIEKYSCVRFQKLSRPDPQDPGSFLNIYSAPKGRVSPAYPKGTGMCAASKGFIQGFKKEIQLAFRCEIGNMIHELLHVLGFAHEHNRNDRDSFLKVDHSNINSKFKHNYKKANKLDYTDGKWGYDYDSIMHYGSHGGFALDGSRPTITTSGGATITAQRIRMSFYDILDLNDMYCQSKYPTNLKALYQADKRKRLRDEPCKSRDAKCWCMFSPAYRQKYATACAKYPSTAPVKWIKDRGQCTALAGQFTKEGWCYCASKPSKWMSAGDTRCATTQPNYLRNGAQCRALGAVFTGEGYCQCTSKNPREWMVVGDRACVGAIQTANRGRTAATATQAGNWKTVWDGRQWKWVRAGQAAANTGQAKWGMVWDGTKWVYAYQDQMAAQTNRANTAARQAYQPQNRYYPNAAINYNRANQYYGQQYQMYRPGYGYGKRK